MKKFILLLLFAALASVDGAARSVSQAVQAPA